MQFDATSRSVLGLCQLELSFPGRKRAFTSTAEMTVDDWMGEREARFHAGFGPSEMIEWE